MHFATIDANGHPTGFYDDVLAASPQGAISITLAQWLSWISDQTQIWKNGALVSAPVTVSALVSEAQAIQETIARGGITVNVGTQAAPQNVKCSTDAASLILLQGAYSMAQANAGATFTWVGTDGTSQNLTAAQVITIFNAVTSFLQSTFTSLSKVISAIGAGTITTMAGVQNPPSTVTTWLVNS